MDWDVTLDALGDEYRRRLLALLLDQETVAVPEELHLGEESLDQLHLALRHQHLPRLEAADFVDWDSATQRVTRGPKFDEIAPVVELLRDHARERGDPWL
jgi:predicted transcriptional regulator